MWRGGPPSAADRLAGGLCQTQATTLPRSIFKAPHCTVVGRPCTSSHAFVCVFSVIVCGGGDWATRCMLRAGVVFVRVWWFLCAPATFVVETHPSRSSRTHPS